MYQIDKLPETIEQIKKDTKMPYYKIADVLGVSMVQLINYRKRENAIPIEVAKKVQEVFKIKLFY